MSFRSVDYRDMVYCEKIDVRLGHIYISQLKTINESFIYKKIKKEDEEFVKFQISKIKGSFNLIKDLLVHPIEITKRFNEVKSVSEQSSSTQYLKISFFQRDLIDELNLKTLRNKKVYSFECWEIIYCLVICLFFLEKNGLPFEHISISDIVMKKSYCSYFYKPFFATLISKEPRAYSFELVKQNIMFILYQVVTNNFNELREFEPGRFDQLSYKDKLVERLDNYDVNLKEFLLALPDPSLMNDFKSILCYLLRIYKKIEYEIIEEELISILKEQLNVT